MAQTYSFDQQLADFESAVSGQIFDAAATLLATKPSRALAALRLMVSYFEAIAKYDSGFGQQGQSRRFFVDGCRLVLARQKRREPGTVEPSTEQLQAFYEIVRCGLAHGATLSRNVALGVGNYALMVSTDGRQMIVNPEGLLELLREDHQIYISSLKPLANEQQRANFQARWDYETSL